MKREGLSCRETERKFEVPRAVITGWERVYLEEGAEGLYIERRGRKATGRRSKPEKKVEEDLIAEAAAASSGERVLIKLNFLVAERVRQEKKRKSEA